ncbi:hypothetical protein PENTCL1PPCAC_5736, partial [Pristionchus entomophagus]
MLLRPMMGKEFSELDREDKDYHQSMFLYLKYQFIVKPLVILIRAKQEDYRRRRLSDSEIKKEIAHNVERLHYN